jgi:hypothetical protein
MCKMLPLNARAAYCLQRANENHLKADDEVDAERREKYRELAWRWDYLAQSHGAAITSYG